MVELISTHIAGWRAGSERDIARHLILSLSSFSKVTHMIAERSVVKTIGQMGFTWNDGETPVYYTISLETQEFPKSIVGMIRKATETLNDAVDVIANKHDDDEMENAMYELADLIDGAKMVKVHVEKRYKDSVEVVGDYKILATDQEMACIIQELDFIIHL